MFSQFKSCCYRYTYLSLIVKRYRFFSWHQTNEKKYTVKIIWHPIHLSSHNFLIIFFTHSECTDLCRWKCSPRHNNQTYIYRVFFFAHVFCLFWCRNNNCLCIALRMTKRIFFKEYTHIFFSPVPGGLFLVGKLPYRKCRMYLFL